MLPTIQSSGEFVVVNRFSYMQHFKILKNRLGIHKSYNRGDVVVSKCPYDASKWICKRISGIEGDCIRIEESAESTSVVVPVGHVWLTGDNKHNSHDSRNYGAVPIALLKGKVECKLGRWYVQRIESSVDK